MPISAARLCALIYPLFAAVLLAVAIVVVSLRVVGAWTVKITTSHWFGETLQGFFGRAFVGFGIASAFHLATRHVPLVPTGRCKRSNSLAGLQRRTTAHQGAPA